MVRGEERFSEAWCLICENVSVTTDSVSKSCLGRCTCDGDVEKERNKPSSGYGSIVIRTEQGKTAVMSE